MPRRGRNNPRQQPQRPEYTAGGLPAFMADLARSTVNLGAPVANRFTVPMMSSEERPRAMKGTAIGGLTWAPDVMGQVASMFPQPSNVGGDPNLTAVPTDDALRLSGDPIREAAGLDPQDPLALAGEFFEPTAAFAKVFKGAMAALKSGKAAGLISAHAAPLVAFFTKQAEKAPIKLEGTRIISTRRPTGKTSPELPDEEYLQVDYDALQADPNLFNKDVKLVTQYSNYRPQPGVTSPNARAEAFIEDITGNLLWLHDQIDPRIAQRSALWYDGTGEIIRRFEQAYPGLDHTQYAGVIAALSPQKDWFMNASLAERVISTKMMFGGHKFDDGMAAVVERWDQAGNLTNAAKASIRNIVGRRLDDLDNPVEQAWFVRLFDEAHNPREFNVISPEGHLMGPKMNKPRRAGEEPLPATVAWGSAGEISKAIDIIMDGSIANISRALGNKHKVRSFFNNISDPNNAFGDVTIDTHAVAAALLRPISGTSTEANHVFSGPSSDILGVQGTYPLYAEAYRRAAAERGLLPRQLQSITWEGVRGLFPREQKTAYLSQEADRIWKLYRDKKISIGEAREAIYDIAGGIQNPSWHVPSVGLHGGARTPAGPGNLPESGVLRSAQGADPGRGTRLAPTIEEAGLPGRKAVEISALRENVDRHVTGGSSPAFRRGDQGNTQRNVATYQLREDHAQRLKSIGADAPPVREMSGMEGAKLFHAAVKQAKKTNKYGAQVSLDTLDNYKDMRLFMTPDGKAGFALKRDGTIVSLFNHGMSPYNGIATEMVMLAVEQGGRRLDNYDTFLSHIYKRLGFEETDRFPWDEAQMPDDWDKEVFKQFNRGEPDYVYMEYRPSGSLVDRLVEGGALGATEEVTQHLPQDMLEGVDLKRFDERLRNTLQ